MPGPLPDPQEIDVASNSCTLRCLIAPCELNAKPVLERSEGFQTQIGTSMAIVTLSLVSMNR
jgi:hypothetical protein